jgi:endonuclease/exonuclease/phosphatase family metal-dependent hydrolase
MADTFRLATFNCENLFARFRFRSGFAPDADGFTINDMAFDIFDETEKQISGAAIRKLDADVLALQEVESLPVLDRFCSRYLGGKGYKHRVLIDGNDPRYIDVAVLSRYPISALRTHRHERTAAGTADLFSRDCLEVGVDIGGKLLVLFVNHFKSMMASDFSSNDDGRTQTHKRRKEQVERVATLVNERCGGGSFDGNFAVLGDFNDFLDEKTSLTALTSHPQLVNGLPRLPESERWTHYWKDGGPLNGYRQLDYILLGKALDTRAGKPAPGVLRDGLPWRAIKYAGDRLPNVGEDEPKASDHCPVYVDIPVAALA